MWSKNKEKPSILQRFNSTFRPSIYELEMAVGSMRVYSIQKVTRQEIAYKRFFTENKSAELEKCIDHVNKTVTGMNVPDWHEALRRMNGRK